MSWTDIFPVLAEDQVVQYRELVTPEEEEKLDEWLSVERVINRQTGVHLVATSLFWKSSESSEGDLPPLDRDMMQKAGERGLVTRFAPWEHYVQPLLDGAAALRRTNPEVVFRVYLAADLVFLVEELVEAGCEVYLMRSSSIRHNPGALWRFFALEEEGRWVTITDSDRAHRVVHDVERTRHVMAAGLRLWRVPYVFARGEPGFAPEFYRPIAAGQFGAQGGMPVNLLMRAFIWHSLRGTMPVRCNVSQWSEGEEVAGSTWPDYGFDEWFLLAALYPRAALDGILTFLVWRQRVLTHWHALDIEYVTWSNPSSEVFRCPEQADDSNQPWEGWKEGGGLRVRPEAGVIWRTRTKGSAERDLFPDYPARDALPSEKFEGDLPSLLEWAGRNLPARWWIDLDPRLEMATAGAELFVDRRYERMDVVVCGCYFVKVTEAIADWAASFGLDRERWRIGQIFKAPKLEGPATLWQADFAKEFHRELAGQEVDPEILLAAWLQSGRAVMAVTTAKEMGWQLRRKI